MDKKRKLRRTKFTGFRHIVSMSGGVGSWAAAKRVVERYGAEKVQLLFADVKDEDPDLYRFIEEAAANVGAPLIVISDGRTPRQVMREVKFIGNSMVDPCSRILKRDLLNKWLYDNCDPADTVSCLGIDWSEEHRFERYCERIKPFHAEAPLCEPPYITKKEIKAWCVSEGIRLPRLYAKGFPHNNCGGACIKAGRSQWKLLLEVNRDLYIEWEEWEEDMRAELGDHSILRNKLGGPLTLRNFRLSIDSNPGLGLTFDDDNDWGGCGCAV